MAINLTPMQQPGQIMGGAVTPVTPYDPRTLNSVAGYNGAVGKSLQPLVDAMMKSKRAKLLDPSNPQNPLVPATPGAPPTGMYQGPDTTPGYS